MSRVLIVSKTRMHGDRICVGGHDLDDAMRSLRLLQPNGANMPSDALFEIGQVWELVYRPRADVKPPHVEDVLVEKQNAKHIDTIAPLGSFLRDRVVIWPEAPFEGKLARTDNGTGYVPIDGPFPSCSTGYWLPEQALRFDGDARYVFSTGGSQRRIRYVGVVDPAERIDIGSLVRVSLARPWSPPNAPDGLYLQISG